MEEIPLLPLPAAIKFTFMPNSKAERRLMGITDFCIEQGGVGGGRDGGVSYNMNTSLTFL